jgi:hypothetical protein
MSRNQLMMDRVCSVLLDNWWITIREPSDELGLSFRSVQSVMTNIWA